MKFPEDLLYTKEHEWLKQEGEYAYVGITDFAQKELGDIVFVEIETLNQVVVQEKVFGTVEAVKTVSDLFMPVTGKIIEINEKILKNPELVNKYPYGDGWLVKIQIITAEECKNLLKASEYKTLIGK